jgi:hypothetical protein
MRFEFIKSLRTPAFAVPTLFFPIMFYLLFGIFLGSMRGNSGQVAVTFATYGVFGAMGPGLFGFGVSLAIEREQGLLTLKQALPQPPAPIYWRAPSWRWCSSRSFRCCSRSWPSQSARSAHVHAGHQPVRDQRARRLPFCAIGMFWARSSRAGIAGHREPHLPAHGVPVGT